MNLDWIRAAVLLTTLAVAVWQDVRGRRIANGLVVLAASCALLVALLHDGSAGVWMALTGGLLGLVVLLPLYAMRAMGAGDVKLMAVVGMLVGANNVFSVLLAVFVAGGVLALVVAAYHRTLERLLGNVRAMGLATVLRLISAAPVEPAISIRSVGQLPYAIAIATGSLAWLFWKNG